MGSELADDALDVVAQGVDADEQPLGDLLVAQAIREEEENRGLAVGEGVAGVAAPLSVDAGEAVVAPEAAARTAAASSSMPSPLVTKPAQPAASASLKGRGRRRR